MTHLFSRRSFVLGAASLLALAHRADAAQRNWYIGRIPDQPFDIPLVDKSLIPVRFHRQSVPYTGREAAGTILINKRERFLYYIEGGGRAVRYGIAVGRDGQRWTGEAVVGRMARWPSWTPTANMRRRNPDLPANLKAADVVPDIVVEKRGEEFAKDATDFFKAQRDIAIPMWDSPVQSFGQDQLTKAIEKIYLKSASVKDALDEAQNLSQAELEKTVK